MRDPRPSPMLEELASNLTHPVLAFASDEAQRQLVALRLASPLRPAEADPVDGLALFDQARSPKLL